MVAAGGQIVGTGLHRGRTRGYLLTPDVAEQAGVQIFAPEPGNGKGNPVAVAKDGVKFAKQKQFDTVIIDTAGRLGVDESLMKEARAVRDATDPDEVLFVLDAMIGQDAVVTAKAFQDGVDFTGVVLTKLDGDARGGAALSVRGLTNRPIIFASTGEALDALEPLHPDLIRRDVTTDGRERWIYSNPIYLRDR